MLGAGGMGIVAAALHLQLDERVAIKFLLPEVLGNPEAVGRFTREARAAVKIKSEHVARVIDVGTLENGAPYIVMEFLEGQDLAAYLQAHGPLPAPRAVEYVLQACEALAEAHRLGIVHRDLKPANLFLTQRADKSDCIKVLDFGISKAAALGGSGGDMALTRTATIMGSPLYMSPEQMVSSRDVDQRTDIWALGAVLFELVTGRPPFIADSLPQLCALVLQGPAPRLRDIAPDAPPTLEAAVAKCLVKDLAERHQTISELATALAPLAPAHARASVDRISRIIGGVSPGAPPVAEPAAVPPAVPGQTTDVAWGQTSRSDRGSRKWLLSMAAVVLIGGGAAAVYFVPSAVSDDAPAAQAAPSAGGAPPAAAVAREAPVEPAPKPVAQSRHGGAKAHRKSQSGVAGIF